LGVRAARECQRQEKGEYTCFQRRVYSVFIRKKGVKRVYP